MQTIYSFDRETTNSCQVLKEVVSVIQSVFCEHKSYSTSTKYNITFVYDSYLKMDPKPFARRQTVSHLLFTRALNLGLLEDKFKFLLQ